MLNEDKNMHFKGLFYGKNVVWHKIGSQYTFVEFTELNGVLIVWNPIPRSLCESPFFWHTAPFSAPELCTLFSYFDIWLSHLF